MLSGCRQGQHGTVRVFRFCLLTGAVVLGAVLAGCGGDGDSASGTSPATSTGPTVSPPVTTSAPSTPGSAEPVLADGKHPVYLTAVDTPGRRLTFDLIQFLTGEAAHDAYVKDHPDDPGGPPNDYYIVNDNPRLRRLSVAENVQVTVLDWEGGFKPQVIAFGDLPAQLAADLVPDDDRIWPNPFWLTVNDDTIIAIEEQYIP